MIDPMLPQLPRVRPPPPVRESTTAAEPITDWTQWVNDARAQIVGPARDAVATQRASQVSRRMVLVTKALPPIGTEWVSTVSPSDAVLLRSTQFWR